MCNVNRCSIKWAQQQDPFLLLFQPIGSNAEQESLIPWCLKQWQTKGLVSALGTSSPPEARGHVTFTNHWDRLSKLSIAVAFPAASNSGGNSSLEKSLPDTHYLLARSINCGFPLRVNNALPH